MRNNLAKVFLSCILVAAVMFLYSSLTELKLTNIKVEVKELGENINQISSLKSDKKTLISENSFTKLKYILLWTSTKNVPFVYMGDGQQGFINRKCPYTDCFVTGNRTFLGDYTNFDVIAFSGPEVVIMKEKHLPSRRSQHQKFAFASIESADNYPVCSDKLNNFFNWTWTYKLDSEAKWGYIVIRDATNKIIGPRRDMHWINVDDMAPVEENVRDKLRNKTKAAAWFVSNCYSRSRREKMVKELSSELKKYDLEIDIYGGCGPFECSRDNEDKCNKIIETDYYFYLSFENSFSEDYVTEKLLYPLKSYTIPVVYGGANYTRFMPDGIYLNAKELGVRKLAKKMKELIDDPEKYAEYFKWRNYYKYYRRHESVETDDYCRFCSILFEEALIKETSTYANFREWWDPPGRC